MQGPGPDSDATDRDPATGTQSAATGGSNRIRVAALLLAVGLLFAAGRMLPLEAALDAVRTWVDGLGAWGPLAFAGIYIAATVLALPGSPLTVVAGALFGGLWGTVLISIASTLGAAAAFLVARYIARDSVAAWLARKPTFRRLDHLTAEHGAVIVALTRLVPLFPFNLLNYGFGLTRVDFWTYAFWSWLCMLPGTVLYVVGTDAVLRAVAEGRVPWPAVAAATVGLAVVVAAGRVARRRLQAREGEA